MIGMEILKPVVVLLAWTMVMWLWMYATRIPAITAAKAPMDPAMTTADLNAVIPPNVRWKADNYNHLMEQPTIFYAAALAIQVAGHGDAWMAGLAWAYVALRVLHSLVQISINRVMARFSLFVLATMVLAVMVGRALILIW